MSGGSKPVLQVVLEYPGLKTRLKACGFKLRRVLDLRQRFVTMRVPV